MVTHSSVWDQKLYEGALDALRESILRQGKVRFGTSSDNIVAALNEIDEKDRLSAILDAVQQTESWDELFAIHEGA